MHALHFLSESLQIFKDLGDILGESNALGNMASIFADQKELVKAIDYYELAYELALKSGDRQNIAAWSGNLGLIQADLGNYFEAIVLYQKQIGIARDIGDKYIEGAAMFNLGIAQKKLGKYKIAKKNCKAGLDILKKIKHVDVAKMQHQFFLLFPERVP